MTPSEVLDAQGDLLSRLDDYTFCKIMDSVAAMDYGRSGGAMQGDGYAAWMKSVLHAAYAYRVTADMSLMIEHAAAGLDGLDRFDHTLAPTGVGFVVFDRPLPMRDARGMMMLIHFMIWGPINTNLGAATSLVMFNDSWRQPDEVQDEMLDWLANYKHEAREKMLEVVGRWSSVGSQVFMDEMRLGPSAVSPNKEHAAALLANGYEPVPGTNAVRYLHAMWLLMNQTITKVAEEYPDRAARRRAGRRNLPPKVTVIRLRREAGATRGEGESLVEWAHRWVVRGHWRWQHVSEHHPLAQEVAPGDWRARIWINPYQKNAHRLDLPLIQSEKVISLER